MDPDDRKRLNCDHHIYIKDVTQNNVAVLLAQGSQTYFFIPSLYESNVKELKTGLQSRDG